MNKRFCDKCGVEIKELLGTITLAENKKFWITADIHRILPNGNWSEGDLCRCCIKGMIK